MPQLRDTMHAVLLTGHGGLDKLVHRRDVPVPKPGPGYVLIAVRAAGVNITDINTRIGWYSRSFSAASTETAETAAARAASETAPEDGSWARTAIAFPRIQGADVCGVSSSSERASLRSDSASA